MRWPVLEVGGVRLAPRQVRHSTTGRRQNECSNGSKTGQCVGKDALAEKICKTTPIQARGYRDVGRGFASQSRWAGDGKAVSELMGGCSNSMGEVCPPVSLSAAWRVEIGAPAQAHGVQSTEYSGAHAQRLWHVLTARSSHIPSTTQQEAAE